MRLKKSLNACEKIAIERRLFQLALDFHSVGEKALYCRYIMLLFINSRFKNDYNWVAQGSLL